MSRRVLVVSFEATDGELVRRWAAEGRLPALGRLAERGSLRPIDSAGEFIQEGTFASAITGRHPGSHGAYGWRVLAPGTVDRIRMDDGTWSKPLWEIAADLAPERELVMLDAPYGAMPESPRQTMVRGWGMRITHQPSSRPEGLFTELAKRHPPHPSWLNREYDRSPRAERRYLRTLLELTERRGDLALELVDRVPWDCAMLVFAEPHYAGHAFYHHQRHADGGGDPSHAADFLLRVYRAADEQLGRLISAAGEDTDVVVFSAMGLRINECSRDLLREVLIAIGLQVPQATSGASRRLQVGERLGHLLLPRSVRHRIGGLVSSRVVEAAADASWTAAIDWGRSRAVAESEPGQSWIRVNLRGREPHGTVEPAERDGLLEAISEEILSLANPDTGEPAVLEVRRAGEVAPGHRSRHFPDLLVRWRPEVPLRAVRHPRLGLIADPGLTPRTEHSRHGFLAAAGPSFAASGPGHRLPPASETDVAAIALHLLGSPLPEELDGALPAGLLAGDPKALRVAYPLATEPAQLR